MGNAPDDQFDECAIRQNGLLATEQFSLDVGEDANMEALLSKEAMKTPTLHRAAFSQAVRLMAAVTVDFAVYELFHLPQGYWAVFTVIIVMQGSIGGTLDASVDRMFGTAAGALVGGTAAAIVPHTPQALGVTLVLCVGATALLAAWMPRFKVAPITVAIMLLSSSGGMSPVHAALYRVVEIGVGGVLGVLATLFVLPARSAPRVAALAAEALDRMVAMLSAFAEALDTGTALESRPDHGELRRALGAVESAMVDAEREHASRLARHAVPAAIPRTLWRVRTDLVSVERASSAALPEEIAAKLGPAAATLLKAESALAGRCAEGLRERTAVGRQDIAARHDDFDAVFAALRASGRMRSLDFDAAGRVFSLAFALQGLHRDLNDLANRVDELALSPPRRRPPA